MALSKIETYGISSNLSREQYEIVSTQLWKIKIKKQKQMLSHHLQYIELSTEFSLHIIFLYSFLNDSIIIIFPAYYLLKS